MKKNIPIILAFLFMISGAYAQNLTLLTFESYTFADKFDTSYGYGKIEDGFQWGIGLEYGIQETNAIELIYQQLKTDGYINYYYGGFNGDARTGVTLSYIMLGGTRYHPINETVSGFGTIDLGMVIASPDSDEFGDASKFAWGIRGGIRIMAPESRVSFRLHAQLFSAVQAAGGGFYFGTGGAGTGVSTYSTIYQFNLGGSLNVRLK